MRVPRPALCLLLAAALPRPSAAQVTASGVTWTLQGIETGFCLHFLAPAAQMKSQIPDGYLPARADKTVGLNPALAREIAAEPQYADWVPSRLCWFALDSVRGLTWVERAKVDKGRGIRYPVVAGYWSAAVVGKVDSTGTNGWGAVSVFTSSGALNQALRTTRYVADDAKLTIEPIEESTDLRYELKFGSTLVSWDGHLGDPVASEILVDTLALSASYVRLHLVAPQGDSAYAPLGNLRLSGKGDLLKALTAGPIRMVGAISVGHAPIDWVFSR